MAQVDRGEAHREPGEIKEANGLKWVTPFNPPKQVVERESPMGHGSRVGTERETENPTVSQSVPAEGVRQTGRRHRAECPALQARQTTRQ